MKHKSSLNFYCQKRWISHVESTADNSVTWVCVCSVIFFIRFLKIRKRTTLLLCKITRRNSGRRKTVPSLTHFHNDIQWLPEGNPTAKKGTRKASRDCRYFCQLKSHICQGGEQWWISAVNHLTPWPYRAQHHWFLKWAKSAAILWLSQYVCCRSRYFPRLLQWSAWTEKVITGARRNSRWPIGHPTWRTAP